MEDLSAVLSVQNLQKSFVAPVFRDLSFDIKKGESVALVGANGAGKSTLIKMILGLVRPDGGSIKLWGDSLGDPSSLKKLSYLPEVPAYWPELSAQEYLMFLGRLSSMGSVPLKNRVEDLLSVLGLKRRGLRRMEGYSKGMLQRCGLAQMLLEEPDFLLLDEPLSGLDPRAQTAVRALLSALRSSGKTMIISSHSLEDIRKLCDRIIVLEKGAKVLDGATEQVLLELEEKYQSSDPWDEDPMGDVCDLL